MIRFDEKEHKYFMGEKNYISVTQLMQKHGLSVDYSSVDQGILRKASEYGNKIHKEVEMCLKGESFPKSQEVKNLFKLFEKENVIAITSELIAYDDNAELAGTIDLIALVNDVETLIDIKTTYAYHENYVSWQLSLYEFLYKKEVPKKCLWLDKEKKEWKLIDVEGFDVTELIMKHIQGETYSLQINNSKMIDLNNRISVLEKELETLKGEQDQYLEVIKGNMKTKGIRQFDSDWIKITYTPARTRKNYDYKKLLDIKNVEVSEEDLEKVKEVSNIKDRLTVTWK